MGYSRFHRGIALRAGALLLTFTLAAWVITHTHWYVNMALILMAALIQIAMFTQFATQSGREVARFLDAVSLDDTSQSFSHLGNDSAYQELGAAMTRVLERLRLSRTQREEQTKYLQTLLAHVPVALITIGSNGRVQLLNMAARRLFETPLITTTQFARHGVAFAAALENLSPGTSAIVRMERVTGPTQMKAAATDLFLGALRQRIVSLQNIESELSAQELAAWQTVIRVMAHEVMSSLTPISSLAGTAHTLVRDVLGRLPSDHGDIAALTDADHALDTVIRRSEGLLHFVQNHRRLTKRYETQIQIVPVRRVFARLSQLLGGELATRDIGFHTVIEPETLEIEADVELLEQALINLVRNGMEALQDVDNPAIELSARRDADSHIVIRVADNGPGISSEQRDKVFVPFFTTKRQGSGVGLTLVRQITAVHSGTVDITETPGGGATINLRF